MDFNYRDEKRVYEVRASLFNSVVFIPFYPRHMEANVCVFVCYSHCEFMSSLCSSNLEPGIGGKGVVHQVVPGAWLELGRAVGRHGTGERHDGGRTLPGDSGVGDEG